jgi:hypothetical protein
VYIDFDGTSPGIVMTDLQARLAPSTSSWGGCPAIARMAESSLSFFS